MGLRDKLSSSLDKVTQEAGKAVEQGRYKVEELQIERQMDAAARKLGYLEYDAQKSGGGVDQERRSELIAEMQSLENQVAKAKQEAEERKQAQEEDESESDRAAREVGFDETGIGPEEVTGIELPEEADRRLHGEE